MSNGFSQEQAARIVQVITFFVSVLKIDTGITDSEMTQVVGAVIFLAATLYSWYRRWQKGDTSVLGFRK